MKNLFIFAFALFLTGCAATKNVDVVATEKAQGDRIVALNSAGHHGFTRLKNG